MAIRSARGNARAIGTTTEGVDSNINIRKTTRKIAFRLVKPVTSLRSAQGTPEGGRELTERISRRLAGALRGQGADVSARVHGHSADGAAVRVRRAGEILVQCSTTTAEHD